MGNRRGKNEANIPLHRYITFIHLAEALMQTYKSDLQMKTI